MGLAAPDMLGRVAPSTSGSARGSPVDAERAPCLTRRLCDARHGTHRAERLFRGGKRVELVTRLDALAQESSIALDRGGIDRSDDPVPDEAGIVVIA